MKRIQFLVFLSWFIPATFCHAQSSSNDVDVAILDVAQVFDEDPVFTTAMEDLKNRTDQLNDKKDQSDVAEARLKELGDELQKLETNAYTECYIRMQKVVGKVSKQHGIKIVFRADTRSIDMDDRADVVKRINSPVVYHHRLDLTRMVIEEMKTSSAISTKSDTLPKRTPKFCDQCGQQLSSGKTDCLCLNQPVKPIENKAANSADQ